MSWQDCAIESIGRRESAGSTAVRWTRGIDQALIQGACENGQFEPMTTDLLLPYLRGYPPELLQQVSDLVRADRLAEAVARRHPQAHEVRTERALYEYVNELKSRFMKSAPPVAKVAYDPKLHILRNVLGTHSAVSRVQGGRLKAKREIRVATLFKEAPADFLRMIVVHELAHLRESAHDKAFHALCLHMEPDYHQLEFDLRLWLTAQDLAAAGRPVRA
jgi:predicted metal-dependent hydrolase